ncbi:Cyanovirin-N [Xylariaceae sp. FL0804]|nr:Cyanovirin-N [Xylariaceae sp. FL0804]
MKMMMKTTNTTAAVVGLALAIVPAAAEWRSTCSVGGDGQFNLLEGVPTLSTMCPGPDGQQVCTKLDLGYCYQNSNGHLVPTINGHFDSSCQDCRLTGQNMTVLACNCKMFGKNAPLQYAEVDTVSGYRG